MAGPGGTTTMENTPQRSDGMASSAPSGMPQQGMSAEGEQASPEEQQQYDMFVNNAYQMLYDDKVLPGVLKSLQGNGDPKEGLANTAAMVVMRVEESAKQNGREISPDVLYHGGTEILESLAETAEAAGLHEYSEDELEGALYRALDIYREMKGGQLNRDAIQQDFAAIVQADQQGNLTDMLPQLKGMKGGGGERKPQPQGLGKGMGDG